MVDDLMILYDYFQTCCTNGFNNHVKLLQSSLFTMLADKKFQECYFNSKRKVQQTTGRGRMCTAVCEGSGWLAANC